MLLLGTLPDMAAAFVDAVTVRVFAKLPSFFVYGKASCLSLVLGHVTVARHRSHDLVDDNLSHYVR